MSAFTDDCTDAQLATARPGSDARRSHRLRRVLGVLLVAVALPAAFATSQAAARTAPPPATEVTIDDADDSACDDALKAAPGVKAPCELLTQEDVSGERLEREVTPSRDDGRGGDASKLRAVLLVYHCHAIGGGWSLCHLVAIIGIYDGARGATEPAPTVATEAEAVASP